MNVLVAGLENPVTIASGEVPDSCIMLQLNAGKIKKIGTGKYICHVTADTSIVKLSIKDTCNNELLGQRIYRINKKVVSRNLVGCPASKHNNGQWRIQSTNRGCRASYRL